LRLRDMELEQRSRLNWWLPSWGRIRTGRRKKRREMYCWLVLVCSERKVLLAGCWWLVCSERKILLAGGW
jgi:hypothetical protein